MNWRKISILVLLAACTACHRKAKNASQPVSTPSAPVASYPALPAIVIPEPPAYATPLPPVVVSSSAPVNVPEPVPAALLEADSAFDSGDFAKAARSYASYLQSNPQTSGMDRILFRFVVAQSLNVAAPKDLSVNDALNRLIREFPHSAYVEPSQVILNLRADIARSQADVKAREETIRQLNDELERLKKIDLGRPKAP